MLGKQCSNVWLGLCLLARSEMTRRGAALPCQLLESLQILPSSFRFLGVEGESGKRQSWGTVNSIASPEVAARAGLPILACVPTPVRSLPGTSLCKQAKPNPHTRGMQAARKTTFLQSAENRPTQNQSAVAKSWWLLC